MTPPEVQDFVPSASKEPSIFHTIRGILSAQKQEPISPVTSSFYNQAPQLPPSASTPTRSPTPTLPELIGRVTQYGPTGNLTATGTVPQENRTAAISPDLLGLIPHGTLLRIGDTIYRVEDVTAPSIHQTVDVFSNNPKGMQRNVPYEIMGRDISGLKYGVKRR